MPLTHVLLALLMAVMWGVNFVVMKHLVSEMPPLAATGLRFLLSSLPLIGFVPRPTVSWRSLLGFGVAFGVVKFSLLFVAFRLGMPAGLAAIVLQMQVVFTIVLAFLLLGERPTPLQWGGVGLALAGAGVVVLGLEGGVALLPVVMTLAAAAAWGTANIVLKRAGTFDPLAFAVWSSLFPGLAMTVFAGVVEGPQTIASAVAQLSWTGMAALAYLAWPITVFSGALWAFLMLRHSAATVAPFALLVPAIGLISGHVVYGETLSRMTYAGGALIVVGLMLNVLVARRGQ